MKSLWCACPRVQRRHFLIDCCCLSYTVARSDVAECWCGLRPWIMGTLTPLAGEGGIWPTGKRNQGLVLQKLLKGILLNISFSKERLKLIQLCICQNTDSGKDFSCQQLRHPRTLWITGIWQQGHSSVSKCEKELRRIFVWNTCFLFSLAWSVAKQLLTATSKKTQSWAVLP